MPRVLLVDDDESFSTGAAELLRARGHEVAVADSIGAARRALNERVPDLLLLDLMLPDGNGVALLSELETERPQRVGIITGHPSIKSVIKDVTGPGVSYLTKPVEPRELVALADSLNVDDEGQYEDARLHFGSLVGESDKMRAIYAQVEQVAPTDGVVLILGESGTGKELVASAIHRQSGRKGKFVPVNCGGFSENLIASELFGHEKGSFTGAARRHAGFFERADGGTLFLDEITEMPVELQTHLLRALETGAIVRVGGEQPVKVQVRLISATNRDPAKAVTEGALREDLYFRLNLFPIELPPLRERGDDIIQLAEYFIGDLNAKYGANKRLSPSALQRFRAYDWPGNVRELKHTVHRAFILAGDTEAEVDAPDRFENAMVGADAVNGLRVGRSISDVEKELILATLKHFDGDKKAAADTLGISLKTLYNRLNAYEDQTDA